MKRASEETLAWLFSLACFIYILRSIKQVLLPAGGFWRAPLVMFFAGALFAVVWMMIAMVCGVVLLTERCRPNPNTEDKALAGPQPASRTARTHPRRSFLLRAHRGAPSAAPVQLVTTHPSAARPGSFSGPVWLVSATLWARGQLLPSWPPATEGPAAVACKFYATLITPEDQAAAALQLVPEAHGKAAGAAGCTTGSIWVSLEGVSVDLLRDVLGRSSPWNKRCPLQLSHPCRPLLADETTMYLFAESGSAKEQWYAALTAAAAPQSTLAITQLQYAQFCSKMANLQVVQPPPMPSPAPPLPPSQKPPPATTPQPEKLTPKQPNASRDTTPPPATKKATPPLAKAKARAAQPAPPAPVKASAPSDPTPRARGGRRGIGLGWIARLFVRGGGGGARSAARGGGAATTSSNAASVGPSTASSVAGSSPVATPRHHSQTDMQQQQHQQQQTGTEGKPTAEVSTGAACAEAPPTAAPTVSSEILSSAISSLPPCQPEHQHRHLLAQQNPNPEQLAAVQMNGCFGSEVAALEIAAPSSTAFSLSIPYDNAGGRRSSQHGGCIMARSTSARAPESCRTDTAVRRVASTESPVVDSKTDDSGLESVPMPVVAVAATAVVPATPGLTMSTTGENPHAVVTAAAATSAPPLAETVVSERTGLRPFTALVSEAVAAGCDATEGHVCNNATSEGLKATVAAAGGSVTAVVPLRLSRPLPSHALMNMDSCGGARTSASQDDTDGADKTGTEQQLSRPTGSSAPCTTATAPAAHAEDILPPPGGTARASHGTPGPTVSCTVAAVVAEEGSLAHASMCESVKTHLQLQPSAHVSSLTVSQQPMAAVGPQPALCPPLDRVGKTPSAATVRTHEVAAAAACSSSSSSATSSSVVADSSSSQRLASVLVQQRSRQGASSMPDLHQALAIVQRTDDEKCGDTRTAATGEEQPASPLPSSSLTSSSLSTSAVVAGGAGGTDGGVETALRWSLDAPVALRRSSAGGAALQRSRFSEMGPQLTQPQQQPQQQQHLQADRAAESVGGDILEVGGGGRGPALSLDAGPVMQRSLSRQDLKRLQKEEQERRKQERQRERAAEEARRAAVRERERAEKQRRQEEEARARQAKDLARFQKQKLGSNRSLVDLETAAVTGTSANATGATAPVPNTPRDTSIPLAALQPEVDGPADGTTVTPPADAAVIATQTAADPRASPPPPAAAAAAVSGIPATQHRAHSPTPSPPPPSGPLPEPPRGALVDGLYGLNMVLLRIGFELLHRVSFQSWLARLIQAKLDVARVPGFLDRLVLRRLSLGDTAPQLQDMKAVAGPNNFTPDNSAWPQLALQIVWVGNASATIATKIHFDPTTEPLTRPVATTAATAAAAATTATASGVISATASPLRSTPSPFRSGAANTDSNIASPSSSRGARAQKKLEPDEACDGVGRGGGGSDVYDQRPDAAAQYGSAFAAAVRVATPESEPAPSGAVECGAAATSSSGGVLDVDRSCGNVTGVVGARERGWGGGAQGYVVGTGVVASGSAADGPGQGGLDVGTREGSSRGNCEVGDVCGGVDGKQGQDGGERSVGQNGPNGTGGDGGTGSCSKAYGGGGSSTRQTGNGISSSTTAAAADRNRIAGGGGSSSSSGGGGKFWWNFVPFFSLLRRTGQALASNTAAWLSGTPVQVQVEATSFEGTLLLWLSPPPSDRLWLSFAEPPRMRFSVTPVLGSRRLSSGLLVGRLSAWVRAKVTAGLARAMVYPACVDVHMGKLLLSIDTPGDAVRPFVCSPPAPPGPSRKPPVEQPQPLQQQNRQYQQQPQQQHAIATPEVDQQRLPDLQVGAMPGSTQAAGRLPRVPSVTTTATTTTTANPGLPVNMLGSGASINTTHNVASVAVNSSAISSSTGTLTAAIVTVVNNLVGGSSDSLVETATRVVRGTSSLLGSSPGMLSPLDGLSIDGRGDEDEGEEGDGMHDLHGEYGEGEAGDWMDPYYSDGGMAPELGLAASQLYHSGVAAGQEVLPYWPAGASAAWEHSSSQAPVSAGGPAGDWGSAGLGHAGPGLGGGSPLGMEVAMGPLGKSPRMSIPSVPSLGALVQQPAQEPQQAPQQGSGRRSGGPLRGLRGVASVVARGIGGVGGAGMRGLGAVGSALGQAMLGPVVHAGERAMLHQQKQNAKPPRSPAVQGQGQKPTLHSAYAEPHQERWNGYSKTVE